MIARAGDISSEAREKKIPRNFLKKNFWHVPNFVKKKKNIY